MTTLTVTGITYLDGCVPLAGIAINSDGDEVNLIFNETPSGQQRVALLDTIEATGEMVASPHHGGRPAFAIHSMKMLRREKGANNGIHDSRRVGSAV